MNLIKKAELLEKAGLKRNEAKTLIYILEKNTTTSKEIEHNMDMRQPEVCLALQKLQLKGWIKKYTQKTNNLKGRPTYIYKLAKQKTVITAEITQQLKKQAEDILRLAQQLEKI